MNQSKQSSTALGKTGEIVSRIGGATKSYFTDSIGFWKADRAQTNLIFSLIHILLLSIFSSLSLTLMTKSTVGNFLKNLLLILFLSAVVFLASAVLKKYLLKVEETFKESISQFGPCFILPAALSIILAILVLIDNDFGVNFFLLLFLILSIPMAGVQLLTNDQNAHREWKWVALVILCLVMTFCVYFLLRVMIFGTLSGLLGGLL